MKKSELQEMIRVIVAEEVKKVLPVMLSEMYVKRIVSEQVNTAAPARQQVPQQKKNISLVEQLTGETDDSDSESGFQRIPTPTMTKQQVRQKIRSTVLENANENPYAALYEGTVIPGEENESPYGEDGIPLEALGIPNFAPITEAISKPVGGAIQETASMVEKRLERQRAKLDSVRVG